MLMASAAPLNTFWIWPVAGLQQEAEERRALEVQAHVRLTRQQEESSRNRAQLEGALADAQAACIAQQALVQAGPLSRLQPSPSQAFAE